MCKDSFNKESKNAVSSYYLFSSTEAMEGEEQLFSMLLKYSLAPVCSPIEIIHRVVFTNCINMDSCNCLYLRMQMKTRKNRGRANDNHTWSRGGLMNNITPYCMYFMFDRSF